MTTHEMGKIDGNKSVGVPPHLIPFYQKAALYETVWTERVSQGTFSKFQAFLKPRSFSDIYYQNGR